MHRALRVGAVLATLLAGFALQRAVALSGTPPRPANLQSVPLAIGSWRGMPDALPAEVLAALRPDNYLLRRYQAADAAPVTLYIAYYSREHLDVRIHSPSACLPAGGWLPVDVGYQAITVPGASPARLSTNRYLIQKGPDRQLVLYWFQGRGRVVANDVKATLYLAYDTLRGRGSDETLVRVSAPVRGSVGATLADEVRFVRLVYPELHRLLAGHRIHGGRTARAGGISAGFRRAPHDVVSAG